VVGRPLQMNGEPSDCQKYITPFIGRLRAALPDKTIDFCDERFTSVLAHRAIIEAGVPKAKRRNKELVDKTAAVIILQSYLLERERKDFV
ncbi:MAG: Holliday junction resolvase RuvX, partial [Mucinivorans sp.]